MFYTSEYTYLKIGKQQPDWSQQQRHQAGLLGEAQAETLWVIWKDLAMGYINDEGVEVIHLQSKLY